MSETIKTTRKINYRSDFDFILKLTSCNGMEIGWPSWDWTARFYTGMKVNAVVASCRGSVCTNCYNDNGRIHVVLDNHRLSPGVLNVEFTAEIPNSDYPDLTESIVTPVALNIELTREAAGCPKDISAELSVPVLKSTTGKNASAVKVLHNRMISYNSHAGEVYSVASRMRIRNAKPGDEFQLGGIVSDKFPVCKERGHSAITVLDVEGRETHYPEIEENNPFVIWNPESKVLKVREDAPFDHMTLLVETKLSCKQCGGFDSKRRLVPLEYDVVRNPRHINVYQSNLNPSIFTLRKKNNIEVQILRRVRIGRISFEGRVYMGVKKNIKNVIQEILDETGAQSIDDVDNNMYKGRWRRFLRFLKKNRAGYRWRWVNGWTGEVIKRSSVGIKTYVRIRRINRQRNGPWEYYCIQGLSISHVKQIPEWIPN